MDRLKDKVVLITGASGAIGKAVAEAVGKAGGSAVTSDRPGQGATHALDVTSEPDWLARDGRRRPHLRTARWAGQRRGHRGARQHRGNRFRHLAEDHGRQSRRHVSRLQARAGAAQAARRLDRQPLVGRGPGRRAQFCRLQRVEGRRAASHQVGGAARRAAQSAGALQLGAPGVPRRADGRRHHARARIFPMRRARASCATFRSAASARRPRSRTCASICCRTNPASSPAPNSSSTAA